MSDLKNKRVSRGSGTVILLALALTACGSNAGPPPPARSEAATNDARFADVVDEVNEMALVEWHGQMTTKNPAKGGRRIFDLNGRYSSSLHYSELSMNSSMDGKSQQVDYLVINDRTYFNSEAWGVQADDCWAEITGDAARTWALPRDLDPTWPVTKARAVGRGTGGDINVAIAARDVLNGMPRGLLPDVPPALDGVEASATIDPHDGLTEVAVDIKKMWRRVPAEQLLRTDTTNAGWWAMTMEESSNLETISAPQYIFDPAETSPNDCHSG